MSVYSSLADTEARIDGELADARDRFALTVELQRRVIAAFMADRPGDLTRLVAVAVEALPVFAAEQVLDALASDAMREVRP